MANYAEELSSINFGSIIGGALGAIVEAQSNAAHTTVDFIKQVGFQSGEDNTVSDPVYVSFRYRKETTPYMPETPAKYELVLKDAGMGYLDGTYSIKSSAGNAIGSATVEDGCVVSTALTGTAPTPSDAGPLTLDATQCDTQALLSLNYTPAQAAQQAKDELMTLQVPILTMMPIPFLRIEEATLDFNVKINAVTTQRSLSKTSYGGSLDANASYRGLLFRTSAKLHATLSNQKTNSSSENVTRDYSLKIHVKIVQDDMPQGAEKLLNILDSAALARPAQSAAAS